LPAGEDETLRIALSQLAIPEMDGSTARVVRIEHGIPRYGEEISERYLVQETQVSDAVHPNKGCYLGHEIVERVRSRGQVHRLLTPIRIKTGHVPEAGAKLTIEGKDAGEIASAAFSPALGEVVGLAYIRTEALATRSGMIVAGAEPASEAYIAA
jgi:tRNA-modifying protein YgfZ